ncbi:hypothetical protein H0G86_008180 [Trichoderma simmonsii]|uniref:Uncharacterized protein n=1 Tax=Trichoderma simmonsii TaxID=1491479 RepID=A0A8G0LI20_9HYPO|nr:hypothetical protein H0G86_008180 [Trichoderma simmonsii]
MLSAADFFHRSVSTDIAIIGPAEIRLIRNAAKSSERLRLSIDQDSSIASSCSFLSLDVCPPLFLAVSKQVHALVPGSFISPQNDQSRHLLAAMVLRACMV